MKTLKDLNIGESLTICTRESENPSLRNNGGDYDFYETYKRVSENEFEVSYSTSSDFEYCDKEGSFQSCKYCNYWDYENKDSEFKTCCTNYFKVVLT